MKQKGSLREFVKNNGRWSGRVLMYDVRVDEWTNYENICNVKESEFMPADGWDEFERSMLKQQIPSLPPDHTVAGYAEWLNRNKYLARNPLHILNIYSVEYATPESYRFYVWRAPEIARGETPQADAFCGFLDYLASAGAGAEACAEAGGQSFEDNSTGAQSQ